MHNYRIIDANINRVSEGIRVLEDIARFQAHDPTTTEALRNLRHQVRKSFNHPHLLRCRDSLSDPGLDISRSSSLDNKRSTADLVSANFKRVQEGLRSIEECLRAAGHYGEAKKYETMRFLSYQLEKEFKPARTLPSTDIYGITGEQLAPGRDNVTAAAEMIDAGVGIIQYREKQKSKLAKYRQCQKIRKLTANAGVTFIVNDDPDIAVAVAADGIHLGQDDLPLKAVRQLVGNMLVGVSTHNPGQAQAAQAGGADYIGVGPMFFTATKTNVEQSAGLDYLQWVSEHISLPHVAIGGITVNNIAKVKESGGRCYALISELARAQSITAKVKEIRQVLADTRAE